MSGGNQKRRIETDVMKLLMSNHDVQLINDNMQELNVKFLGPKDTPYEGGIWRLHVELPDNYPYKSPSIGFVNKIFHPNIDVASGSICLDVINSTWSPLYDLINIIEWMIPGLLKEPNGSDPLNNEAASLQLRDKKRYEEKIKEYIKKYATEEKYKAMFGDSEDSSDEDQDNDFDEEEEDIDDDNSDNEIGLRGKNRKHDKEEEEEEEEEEEDGIYNTSRKRSNNSSGKVDEINDGIDSDDEDEEDINDEELSELSDIELSDEEDEDSKI